MPPAPRRGLNAVVTRFWSFAAPAYHLPGPGFALADVTIGRTPSLDNPRDGFWLYDRGPIPAALWTYQNWHGKRWYRRHGARQNQYARPLPHFTGDTAS
jgi:hypothetical protein